MVSAFGLLASTALASSVAKAAQVFNVDIDFKDDLDVFYYFRQDNDLVSVQPNDSGLLVTVNADNACEILQSGMVVYNVDGGSANTLLTWNQYDVFHLVDGQGQDLTWSSVNVQSCGSGTPATSGSMSAAQTTMTTTSGGVVPVQSSVGSSVTTPTSVIATTNVAASTGVVLTSSMITTAVSGQVTEYPTFYPVSTIGCTNGSQALSVATVTTSHTYTVGQTITYCGGEACYASVVTSVETGSAIPATGAAAPSITTSASPGSSASQGQAASSASQGQASTPASSVTAAAPASSGSGNTKTGSVTAANDDSNVETASTVIQRPSSVTTATTSGSSGQIVSVSSYEGAANAIASPGRSLLALAAAAPALMGVLL
ncbi:LAMI_0F01112g1_1 [Lachancea mirantina]|uniref:LAMI_0F01112g1_1 n=1 Tax=Lachancea mirantina TaxID=1230905 RepID=A0A1G4JVT4_9SACH|nr:LAMI_0F01112g1_1 [Lachancea mirantina]